MVVSLWVTGLFDKKPILCIRVTRVFSKYIVGKYRKFKPVRASQASSHLARKGTR